MLQLVKNPPAHAGDTGDPGSIPGLGRSGGGNGNLLQHSCLEDSTDRGAWWAAVYGVARGRARLSTCTGTVPQAYQQELLSSPSGSQH